MNQEKNSLQNFLLHFLELITNIHIPNFFAVLGILAMNLHFNLRCCKSCITS